MKNMLRYSAAGIILIFLFVGCSKQPAKEINETKSAVDAVMAEGAEKYAAADAKKLNDGLSAAMEELKVQDGKFMKNYARAKELLANVKAEADTLKSGLAAKKEEVRKNAAAAQEFAKAAIEEAKALLSKAPKGKALKAEIEALNADVKGLEESFPEVQKLIDSEDYTAALDKANAVKGKAAGVSEQIKQAIEKAGAKKK